LAALVRDAHRSNIDASRFHLVVVSRQARDGRQASARSPAFQPGNPKPATIGRMAQDQPATSREQLARQAVEAYNELTAHAEELSPAAALAVRSLRETLTSLVALGTAADVQIADMERTMEEFEAIFHGGG